MKTFIKPSGIEVQVNQNSEAYAISLGWVEKKATDPVTDQVTDQVKEFKQRGRPRKEV